MAENAQSFSERKDEAQRERIRHIEETRAKADLGKAIWEVSQYISLDEIQEYVTGVLNEIKSDEP